MGAVETTERQEWKAGSKCEVFSVSKKTWYPAIITKTVGVKHLEVEYGGYTKNLQRNGEHIRPSRQVADGKAVSLVQNKQINVQVVKRNQTIVKNVYVTVNNNTPKKAGKEKPRLTSDEQEAWAKKFLLVPYKGYELRFKPDGTVDKRCKAFKEMVNDGYLMFDSNNKVRPSCKGYKRWTAIQVRSLGHANGVRFTYRTDGTRKRK